RRKFLFPGDTDHIGWVHRPRTASVPACPDPAAAPRPPPIRESARDAGYEPVPPRGERTGSVAMKSRMTASSNDALKRRAMTERITAGGLQVAKVLYDFVNDTALPAAGITDKDAFWQGFGDIVEKHTPRNVELLAKREELQAKLDEWYRENPGKQDQDSYVAFLKEIGYLVEDPGEYEVTTANVDTEITSTAGPQLVVPVLNARFAINAA